MNEHIAGLLAVVDAYLSAQDGLAEKTLSFRVFGDSKTINLLRSGSDITTGRMQQAIEWFSAKWPAGTVWPQAVKRPGAIQERAA